MIFVFVKYVQKTRAVLVPLEECVYAYDFTERLIRSSERIRSTNGSTLP
jgi:hypothetical protein